MTLSTEIAAARPEQQREMLERLWVALGNEMPGRAYNYVHDYPYRTGDERTLKFTAMLDCGAFLSAVEMLVGEITTLEFHCDEDERWECLFVASTLPFYGYGNSRPLALAAAIAKSLEEG